MGEYADDCVMAAMDEWIYDLHYEDDDGYEGRLFPRRNKRRKQPSMIIEGTIYWTKLDKPRDNWNKQKKVMDKEGNPDRWGREYSVTLGNLSKETKLQLRDVGLLDKVKNKMDDQDDHITFRLDEFNKDGEVNEFKVFNAETGEPWDWKEDGLIGNLSRGAVKFNVWKVPGIKARIYPLSLLVTEHVEFEQTEGTVEKEDADDWSNYVRAETDKVAAKHPGTKGTPEKAKPASKRAISDEDLDDDVPY